MHLRHVDGDVFRGIQTMPHFFGTLHCFANTISVTLSACIAASHTREVSDSNPRHGVHVVPHSVPAFRTILYTRYTMQYQSCEEQLTESRAGWLYAPPKLTVPNKRRHAQSHANSRHTQRPYRSSTHAANASCHCRARPFPRVYSSAAEARASEYIQSQPPQSSGSHQFALRHLARRYAPRCSHAGDSQTRPN